MARDELNVPGLLDPALWARISRARNRGARVQIDPGDYAPQDVSTVATRILDRTLDQLQTNDLVRLHGLCRSGFDLAIISSFAKTMEPMIRRVAPAWSVRVEMDDFATTYRLRAPERVS